MQAYNSFRRRDHDKNKKKDTLLYVYRNSYLTRKKNKEIKITDLDILAIDTVY